MVLRTTPSRFSAVPPAELSCAIWGDAGLTTTLHGALSMSCCSLGLGGGNKGSGSGWSADGQRDSGGRGRYARGFRRAFLPSDGVAVFAHGIRTMTLCRKRDKSSLEASLTGKSTYNCDEATMVAVLVTLTPCVWDKSTTSAGNALRLRRG